jgi:hypothetical protein
MTFKKMTLTKTKPMIMTLRIKADRITILRIMTLNILGLMTQHIEYTHSIMTLSIMLY